jgi:hypothetical protein
MDDLTHTLYVLCRRNRDGSLTTQADRLRTLTLASRQLKEAGFRRMRASSLKRKHVDALLERWQAQALSAGTLKNRLAHLRWWAEKVGRESLIPADNARLAIPQRRHVTNENKARRLGDNLERVSDPHVRMSLTLQQAFGLRREESIKFQPRYADRGDCIALKGSWTKGGRPRTVPITTAEQRTVLDDAHRLVGAGSLIPALRRCSGWMGSAVRTILRNPLYTGRVRWNAGGYVRNPDTAKRVWRARPQDEWVEHCEESVRIISDELFQRAQERN